jgi:hypothetical protein
MNPTPCAGYSIIAMSRFLAVLAFSAGAAMPAVAQVTTLDEGVFVISRNGAAVGRESFSIKSSPGGMGGPVVQARATVSYDDRRLTPVLKADSIGSPTEYQLEVRAGANASEVLKGVIRRGRFSATMQTPRGENLKEYVVSEGALVLDEDVFHQYYFLARGNRTGEVPVVVPHRNVQVVMRIENRGNATVTVGGQSLPARALVLVDPAGGNREIWVDAQGRVLKVAIPSRGILAVREEPPR